MAKKIAAILLAGGKGKRFGSPLPKQFHSVGGKPVFLRTLENFVETGFFSYIVIPCPEDRHDFIREQITRAKIDLEIRIISGGKTRQESSRLALEACDSDTDYVVIHDAVRPFAGKSIIEKNIQTVLLGNAVDTCIPSTDTIVRSTDGRKIDEIPNRKEFFRGQTPQSFSYSLISSAHKKACKDGIVDSSDDCGLVRRLGIPVFLVEGGEYNIKITSELDLAQAERLLHHPIEAFSRNTTRSLLGRRYVVTGATGGIGKSVCSLLREEGADPVEVSKTAIPFSADLTRFPSAQKVFEEIYERYGLVDGLINCIGSFTVKSLHILSPSEIEEMIATNLTGVIYSCQLCQIRPEGHIVNIASSSYSRGRKEYPIYSAAKAGVVNFTQALAEIRPELHVHALVPQRTDTPMRRTNFPEENPNLLLQPEEIAEKITGLLKNTDRSGVLVEVRKQYAPSFSS